MLESIFGDVRDFWKEFFSTKIEHNISDYKWFAKTFLLLLGMTLLAVVIVTSSAILYSIAVTIRFIGKVIEFKSLREAAYSTLDFAERGAEYINEQWKNKKE